MLYHELVKKLSGNEHIVNADIVARRLMANTLNIDEVEVITSKELSFSADQEKLLSDAVSRLMNGEPLTKIIGQTEFWGLPFKVTQDVLDPRPDTETLIESVIKRYGQQSPKTILDLGTGSGCIIISLLKEYPEAQAVAVDISDKALSVARENAQINDVADRIQWVEADWFDSVDGKFDLIVSNPPYIDESNIPNLMAQVKNHDPFLALSGGKNGIDSYKKIISGLNMHLNPYGFCFLEIGYDQSEKIIRLVKDSGLNVSAIYPDLSGILRVVEISFGEK